MHLIPAETTAMAEMVLADELLPSDRPLSPAGTPNEKARPQPVLDRLSFLFRNNASDVTSQALFRALYAYRTEAS